MLGHLPDAWDLTHVSCPTRELTQCSTCRFVVATTTSKDVLLWTLLGPVTIAGSLGTPVQTIAIKRFTTESNRWAFFAVSSVSSCASSLRDFHGFLYDGEFRCDRHWRQGRS